MPKYLPDNVADDKDIAQTMSMVGLWQYLALVFSKNSPANKDICQTI